MRNISVKPVRKERYGDVLILHQDDIVLYNEQVGANTHLLIIETDQTLRMQRMVYVRTANWESLDFQLAVKKFLKGLKFAPRNFYNNQNQNTTQQKTDDPIL